MITKYHPETDEYSENSYIIEPVVEPGVVAALEILIGSKWFTDELENANYHDFYGTNGFLSQLLEEAKKEHELLANGARVWTEDE